MSMNRIGSRWSVQFIQSPSGVLWNEGDTGGDANASGSGSAAPTSPAPSAPTSPGAPAQSAATQPAPPTSAGTTPSASGVPEGWVPSYRLRESREAAAREAAAHFADRERQYQARLEQVQSQLHALVGVQPPQNPEVDAVRGQFSQLYPGLSKLEERAQDVMQLIERAGDLETQTSHYWSTYGRQQMDRLFSQAEKSLGGPLTDEGKRSLHTSFVGFVGSSPELTARYANDPSIVEEFWSAFSNSFIDPVRRTSQAGLQTRAGAATHLPQDTTGGIPRPAGPPSMGNLDDRVNMAFQRFQQLKAGQ